MENIKKRLEELSFNFTQIFNENLRKFITVKIIDNILVYTFYILIIITSFYAACTLILDAISLISDICWKFGDKSADSKFPYILTFSEHLFLYFLPVFILYGLLAFYQRGLSKYTDTFAKQDSKQFENSEVALHLSKKLFFTSVLSYISLKIIEILFFNFKEDENSPTKLISIGIFFIFLIIVIILHTHKNKDSKNDIT